MVLGCSRGLPKYTGRRWNTAPQPRQHKAPLCAWSPPSSCDSTFGGPSISMWTSRQDSAARAELCHGGGSDATLDMTAVGSPPPPCMPTSVLGRGRHEETLAQACVPCLVPAGHPAPLPCHGKAGPRRGSGAWSPLCLVGGVLFVWVVLHSMQDLQRFSGRSQEPLALVASVSSLWGSVCLGCAAQHAGSLSPNRG